MDIECRGLLRITWDLVLREHKLLELMVPTTQDIANCAIEGRKPTPAQADAWKEMQRTAIQAMLELTSGLDALRKSVEPLIGFDA